MADDNDRHSEFLGSTPLPALTEGQRAQIEAANTLLQTDKTLHLVEKAVAGNFRLRPSIVQELNRIALQQVEKDAGRWRDGPIKIGKSKHQPPPAIEVPALIDDMCEYVNDNWNKSGLHLAAYVMWRLNWIHPFVDGNGRTTRAVSYIVLCGRLGFYFPGVTAIPELIARNKDPYYEALEKADSVLKKDGTLDVSEMESLLKNLLATQFLAAIEQGEPPGQKRLQGGVRANTSTLDEKSMTTPTGRVDSESDSLTRKAALLFGAVTLLFLMSLIIIEIFQQPVPQSARWLVVLFFAFSGGLSAAFWGGGASVRGTVQVPVLGEKNVRFNAYGGVAVVIILLILGKLLFL